MAFAVRYIFRDQTQYKNLNVQLGPAVIVAVAGQTVNQFAQRGVKVPNKPLKSLCQLVRPWCAKALRPMPRMVNSSLILLAGRLLRIRARPA
ncbi:MAG: hypothetical protein QOJ41_681 [Acidobacteriaceae bacterium]|jgi:hypothetical protein|nr:hypothetical protein [Acidobacteriaceae bacterium]